MTLPEHVPAVTDETATFWAGCARGVLVLPRCTVCQTWIWFPRRHCPSCGAREVSWQETSGRGRVYSHTVVHQSAGSHREAVPYVVAYVELDEGPRLLANIVHCDPATVHVDQQVRVVFEPTSGGPPMYRFVAA